MMFASIVPLTGIELVVIPTRLLFAAFRKRIAEEHRGIMQITTLTNS